MNKDTLLQRQAEIQGQFDTISKQLQDLGDQHQSLIEQQLSLKGAHDEVTNLISQFVEPTSEPVEGEVVA